VAKREDKREGGTDMIIQLSKKIRIDTDDETIKKKGVRVAIIGESGSGKSYAIAKILENALDQNAQICVIDIHGEYHTLQEIYPNQTVVCGRDPIPIGIDFIDSVYMPLIRMGKSLIMDARELALDEDDFSKFCEKFIRAFWREQVNNPKPILFVMEEAQIIAPQEKSFDVMRRVKLLKSLATGGRKFGIFFILSTQRPAELHKTPLSQTWIRLFGSLTEKRDYDAIKIYLKGKTYEEINHLKIGEFFLFGLSEEPIKFKVSSDRKSKDAAETPEFEWRPQTIEQKQDMKGVLELIEKAHVKKKAKLDEITKLQRKIEKQKEQIDTQEKTIESLESSKILEEKLAQAFGNIKGTNVTEVKEVLSDDIQNILSQKDDKIRRLSEKASSLERTMKEVSKREQEIRMFNNKRGKIIRALASARKDGKAWKMVKVLEELYDQLVIPDEKVEGLEELPQDFKNKHDFISADVVKKEVQNAISRSSYSKTTFMKAIAVLLEKDDVKSEEIAVRSGYSVTTVRAVLRELIGSKIVKEHDYRYSLDIEALKKIIEIQEQRERTESVMKEFL